MHHVNTHSNLQRLYGHTAPGWDRSGAECQTRWWQLLEHIVELEELIADLRANDDETSAIIVRRLSNTLQQQLDVLKSIDVG
ncbi:MAG: hypothetical protein ACT4NU_06890 [Chromatiales bacterium]